MRVHSIVAVSYRGFKTIAMTYKKLLAYLCEEQIRRWCAIRVRVALALSPGCRPHWALFA